MKRITLKEFEVVVDDFTKKTIDIDRHLICRHLMLVYMEHIGTDSEIDIRGEGAVRALQASDRIDVKRYTCWIDWRKEYFPVKKEYFAVHFSPKNGRESSFTKTLAEFLHFYDNPAGIFRLEQLSFQLQ